LKLLTRWSVFARSIGRHSAFSETTSITSRKVSEMLRRKRKLPPQVVLRCSLQLPLPTRSQRQPQPPKLSDLPHRQESARAKMPSLKKRVQTHDLLSHPQRGHAQTGHRMLASSMYM
jgi:hypothetical protein